MRVIEHLDSTIKQLPPKARSITKQNVVPFLYALPFVGFLFLFAYLPLFGWVYAFFDYKPGLPLFDSPYVGFKYLAMMFNEWSQVGRVLTNTLVLSLMGLLLTPLPAIFAVLLNEVRGSRFRRVVQTITTLPNFISWIIVFGLFFSLFSMEGMVTRLLTDLGWISPTQNILGDSDLAWFLQVALGVWKTLGWSAIIYLAAIVGIDQELYDAASVDGAGRWGKIWHITVPGIAPTYLVLLLLSISGMLSNGFDQFFVFTNPLVSDRLQVLDVYLYDIGIRMGNYSYSTALGIWKTLISIALLMTANFVSKKLRGGDSLF